MEVISEVALAVDANESPRTRCTMVESALSTRVETRGKVVVINQNSTSWRIDRRSFDFRKGSIDVDIDEFGGVFQDADRSIPTLAHEQERIIHSSLNESSHRKPCLGGCNLAIQALTALGVVFGDLGTSPLYTVQAIFSSLPATRENVIGAISALFWLMNIVVTLKYVTIIMRVNNKGEGGIMALTALASKSTHRLSRPWWKSATIFIGMFGASCFFGDSIITPAISVLSAVEGLAVATPTFVGRTMPIAVMVLLGLFFIQRFGTGTVGRFFGPVMFLWCFMISVVGFNQMVQEPTILTALNPAHAVAFLHSASDGQDGQGLFLTLGNIVLVVTGGEALYADMGHFGVGPIRLAWLAIVLPGVTLSYLGQGALLLRNPDAAYSPFYLQFPEGLVIPAVILSTLATVIASQAVIAGCYSMMSQAIKLGFLPRMDVHHTSADQQGQIYIPIVNFILMVAVVALTAGFARSSELTSAFGMAVTMTMMIDGLLTYVVVSRWMWKRGWAAPLAPLLLLMGGLFVLDVLLVVSCSLKFLQGAWLPLFVALVLLVVMTTWSRGSELLSAAILTGRPPLEPFVGWLAGEAMPRAERAGLYMVSDTHTVPQALLHNLKHSQMLHEAVLFVNVVFNDEPRVPPAHQLELQQLAPGFWRVLVHYGFMDHPDIPEAVERLHTVGLPVDPRLVSYYLSRSIVVPLQSSQGSTCCFAGMAYWRKLLFCLVHRNAGNAVDYFRLPEEAVMLGSLVHI